MFYCFPNEIQLPGTQSFSIFGSGRVGYLKKSLGRVGYRDPVRPCRGVNVSWEQELKSNLFISRQMMEDHGDKPFGVMERLTREKEEAARKLREEQDQREKEEEERRMKEMLCKQNEGPGSASSSRQRIRAILEKQKRQRVRV